jgi:hypothetical protein
MGKKWPEGRLITGFGCRPESLIQKREFTNAAIQRVNNSAI